MGDGTRTLSGEDRHHRPSCAGGRRREPRLTEGDKNSHQGRYGEAYVQAVAAAAGLIAVPDPSQTLGWDYQISTRTSSGLRAVPTLHVQVKSWSTPELNADRTCWKYPRLNEKQFNKLAGHRREVWYLVVVMVPPEPESYADLHPNPLSRALHEEYRLVMSYGAYWASLQDREPISDPSGRRKVTVDVPCANVLTPRTLLDLMYAEPVEIHHITPYEAAGRAHATSTHSEVGR